MISPQLTRLFDSPPREFGPTPLWWWSGAEVTPERLEWQLRRFDEGGIHNLVVINLAPAGPLFGASADDPAWFSERWWELFQRTCDIAADRGMRIWFYDQIGFSGANVQGLITNDHPEAEGRSLRMRGTRAARDRVELAGNETLVAAYDSSGRRVESAADGRVGAREGEALQLVTAVPTAYDYLDPRAVELIIDRVHGEYERRMPQHLGSVIAGSFQDEAPAANAWTPRFADEFLRRRGYDILDHLPSLFGGSDRVHGKVRGDYYAVRSELAQEAFFEPLGRWHRQRGMLIGADQSNPARAGYPTQGTQLYTDYIRTHRWYGAVGSDHEGDAKIHSSIAHLYDHPRVWIESFHSSGWGGTLEETYDWLLPFLRSGANLYNPHASYFGTAGGWFEWAPPSTDWRQPYWQQYPAFSRAVARIASMMSWGAYDADVAVLHPTATAQSGLALDLPVDHFGEGETGAELAAEVDAAQRTYLELVGTNNWFRTRLGALDRGRVAFDVIDDDSLVREPLREGSVRVSAQRYRAIVLPAATVLEEATAHRLRELLDAGGRVLIVGADPRMTAGRSGDDEAVAALTAHPRVERHSDAEAATQALAELRGHAECDDVPVLVRRSGRDGIALVTGAFPGASGMRDASSTGSSAPEASFDPARYADERVLRVRATVAEAVVMDPASGRTWAPRIRHEGAGSALEFRTGGAPAVMVAWHEADAGRRTGETAADAGGGDPIGGTAADADSGHPARKEAPGADTAHRSDEETAMAPAAGVADAAGDAARGEIRIDDWTGELIPTMDNSWGDLALPLGTDVRALQVWSFEWREQTGAREDGAWCEARATYGHRVRTLGPVPVGDAPEPLSRADVDAILRGERPLAGGAWSTGVFSASRGARDLGRGTLGHKGIVPEEFVRVPVTGAGETAVVRALVSSELTGEAELIVGAGAEKTVWWNGERVADTTAHTARVVVDASGPVNVLEYRLGPGRNAPGVAGAGDVLGSYFSLARDWVPRPEFMRAPEAVEPDGAVRYSAELTLPADADRARLIVGAAVGVTVRIDDAVVARQAKVEYYEGAWGAAPAYFAHDVAALLTAGRHRIEIVAESVRAEDAVFADLVAHSDEGVHTLVSGAGWDVVAGDRTGRSEEHLGHWDEPASTHAAIRPHPLPGPDWLRGPAELGEAAPAFQATDEIAPAVQEYRFTVPAGTTMIEVPLLLSAQAEIDGSAAELDNGRIRLREAARTPATVTLRTEPTTFHRGGAAFDGPLRVYTVPAPIALGDWRDVGVGAWSGGVRYATRVEVPHDAGEAWLDLGRVRGSVRVEVDGELVADLFCGPFLVDLGQRRGRVDVAVTVNNTLGPFLAESTPTAWIFPSQLASGLFGPVTLRTS